MSAAMWTLTGISAALSSTRYIKIRKFARIMQRPGGCNAGWNGTINEKNRPRRKKHLDLEMFASYDRNMNTATLEQYPPTVTEYVGFQQAFNHFNETLFSDCKLPEVLITLRASSPRSRGFFCADAFAGRGDDKTTVHEIALNVDKFAGRTDADILSTLVHEMAHLWQQVHGKPPRGCYHDRQWAAKMKDVGLQPSDTGAPGGKETGQKCSHYIIEGGRYAVSCTKLLEGGYRLHWQSPVFDAVVVAVKAKKRASKTKYTCPECDSNAWAKPDANLMCGDCEVRMDPVE